MLQPLESRPNLTEPLKTWVVLHECAAKLLAGEFWSASDLVARLDTYATARSGGDDEQRRQFLNALKSLMLTRENALFISDASNSADSYEPAGCLIAGLKEWDASRFEIADNLFQRFLEFKPKGAWAWMDDFKPLVAQYRADYESFRALDAQIKSASTPANRATILQQIPGVKAKLKRPGRLPEALSIYEKSMQPELQSASDIGIQRGAVPLPVLYAGVMKSLSEMMPNQAKQLIADTTVASAEDAGKQALLKKANFIESFKRSLINDLLRSSDGSRWIARRSGPWVFGPITRANDTQIQVQCDGREVTIPWSDVMPSTVLVWADSLNNNSNKLWFSGVYACVSGYTKEGLTRLKLGAQLRPEHRADLSIFESAR